MTVLMAVPTLSCKCCPQGRSPSETLSFSQDHISKQKGTFLEGGCFWSLSLGGLLPGIGRNPSSSISGPSRDCNSLLRSRERRGLRCAKRLALTTPCRGQLITGSRGCQVHPIPLSCLQVSCPQVSCSRVPHRRDRSHRSGRTYRKAWKSPIAAVRSESKSTTSSWSSWSSCPPAPPILFALYFEYMIS